MKSNAQNPPNELLYVNVVPSASVMSEPSPPVIAPVGDSGFDPSPPEPEPPLPPGPEPEPELFLMTVKYTGKITASTITTIAAAPRPSQTKRRWRLVWAEASPFSETTGTGMSESCRAGSSKRIGREGLGEGPGVTSPTYEPRAGVAKGFEAGVVGKGVSEAFMFMLASRSGVPCSLTFAAEFEVGTCASASAKGERVKWERSSREPEDMTVRGEERPGLDGGGGGPGRARDAERRRPG